MLTADAQNAVIGSGAPGANINGGNLVLQHAADDTTLATSVKAALTAGYGQTPKFSSGTYRDPANATDPNRGLGWKDDGSNTIVTGTYFGDANLDLTVNTADFTTMAANFSKTGQNWVDGDFNYDGKINALDFNAIATNFGKTIVPPNDVALTSTLGSLVPEPGSLGLLAVGLASLAGRRRRK